MYAACRPQAIWGQRLAAVCVYLLGPRALPGATIDWVPPLSPDSWREAVSLWRDEVGPFDGIAVHQRARSTAQTLLLLRAGAPVAFVRMHPGDGSAMAREADVLTRLATFGTRSFAAPVILSLGERGGWHFLVTEPLAAGMHRPARNPPLAEITTEIGEALGDLPRPAGTPDHWRPMHGDLTPWNLRRLRTGILGLYDWEGAGWGPPAADEVLYRAAWAALGRRPLAVAPRAPREAIRFWEERVLGRPVTAERRDRELAEALLRALHAERSESRSEGVDGSGLSVPVASGRA
jgi:hypothetical protein